MSEYAPLEMRRAWADSQVDLLAENLARCIDPSPNDEGVEALKTAKDYKLKTHRHGDDLKDTTTGAAVGAAAGAAAGAVGGASGASVGVGAAAGAAGGAAAGTTNTFFRWIFGSSDPPPAYRAFVERQLREKGYDVIGWE